jgi:hypothetical protein
MNNEDNLQKNVPIQYKKDQPKLILDKLIFQDTGVCSAYRSTLHDLQVDHQFE